MDKITYEDVEEYESLFSLAPPFLLEMFAKKNKNIVLKFKSTIQSFIYKLTEDEKNKLEIILNSDIEELQSIMKEAYIKSEKKQYNILANPQYRQFIEININEIKNIVKSLQNQ